MAVTGSARRVVVGLKSRDSTGLVLANFIDCIVNHFNPNSMSVQLCCKLENNVLVLCPPPTDLGLGLEAEQNEQKNIKNRPNSRPTNNVSPTHPTEYTCLTLEHSPACPVWLLGGDVDPGEDRGVMVAVATILESSDGHVLVTQRADRMRTFPRAWVPPGGHVEAGETLSGAAARELSEETGLDLARLQHGSRPLCMWESVYPPYLGMGRPRNHHVVVYLHTTVCVTRSQLHAALKLDPGEVQGCAWLSRRDVEVICSTNDEPAIVDRFEAGPDGRLASSGPIDLSGLFPMKLAGRNYSGLQAALNRWLRVGARPPSKM